MRTSSLTPDDDGQLSPAEKYARSRARQAQQRSELGAFQRTLEFEMDAFQQEACQHLEQGKSVLVAAPTGAGKTVVGEFAIYRALTHDQKAFYTTPIKALSNQKYNDLVNIYGHEKIGLLTGDTAINAHAQIVVMTTEVLRNMLYADSQLLVDLGYVIMDEVHYLADRFRGAVWEEVIIHLPDRVQMVALSATVSNAEEFGAWIDTVRGTTAVVVSEHRPVPLWQYIMAGNQLYDLFSTEVAFDDERVIAEAETLEKAPERSTLVLNPELAQLAEEQRRHEQRSSWGKPARRGSRNRGPHRGREGRGAATQQRSGAAPMARDLRVSRPRMVRMLEREGLLPCIAFIFSRAGCDGAVEQCLAAGLDLTTPAEKRQIERAVDTAGETLSQHDRDVLGFWGWRDGLRRGFAAHHAGMLPPFKEVVEELFGQGLIKVVFATETLALGINMPARTVVIEKLEKFNGESHVNITAGEYTQLAGRAGRRGIDIEGHAVVMWRPGLDPAAVAGLASRRTYPLNSSFRPTYNMSVNLLSQFGQHRSRSILESSFAQFQADRSVVGLAREVRNREKSLAGYEESMQCHLGDFTEYARLRRELSDLEKSSSRTRQRAHRRAITDALNRLKVGDIIKVAGPRRLGQAVVVSSAGNPTNPRVGVVTSKAQLRRVSVDDLTEPIAPFAGVELDKNLPLKTPTQRKNVASAMRNAVQERRPSISGDSSTPTTFRYRDEAAYLRIDEVRRQLQSHPCHGCADRESHARWANRWSKLRQETDGLIANIAGRTNTIARTFDRLVQLLASYHYVEPLEDDEHTYQVTERGHTLRRIYGERDLLTSLLIDEGHADQLDPEELTGLAALLVYQDKLDGAAVLPKMPSESLQQAAEAADSLWFTLQNAEAAAKLDITPEPHPGLVWPIMRWARGQDLARTLRGSDLAAGDFVRWARQVIDALDQLANIPGHHDLSRRCRKAKDLIHRGIVSYSSVDKVES